MMRKIARLILVLAFSTPVAMAARTSFDAEWKFIQQEVTGAEKPDHDDEKWRTLDVPHDWSIEGEYSKDNPMGDTGGYLPAGIGWYRKTVAVPAEWKGKHVEIAFDGVYMNSTVWANGRKLGNRPYGWSSFAYDISDVVDESDSITFAVRADNSKQPSARWYTGSGIYAHTWIDVKDKVHVPASGVFVRTKGNEVFVDTELVNRGEASVKVQLKTSIRNKAGESVADSTSEMSLKAEGDSVSTQKLALKNPELWSDESPVLYTAVSEVLVDGKVVDTVRTRFGFREIEWKAATGMWLNGKNVKLRGVCNHQDAGALGAAVPDKILRFRIEQLKAMGCNAIRVSHNPQTPIFYEICDEVGMLVMDEIFDGWKRKAAQDYGGRFFKEWWKRDLTDWIKRDRNHPSIVIYSVGNETGGPVGKELVARCHELDPTRPVTSGHSGSEFMDVHGVNGSSEKNDWWEKLAKDKKFKDKVFIGTENTHTWQVRGFYRSQTWYRNGYPNKNQKPYKTPDLTKKEIFKYDWTAGEGRGNAKQIFNSSYDNAMVRLNSRLNIEQLRDKPIYAGSFRWTGHDYIGEAGYVHGGWPFKAFMGGAIDLANFEKDLYYLYQSQWTDEPMVHILPHWTHPTMESGTEIPVWVYSNCDSVELFFGDKSLGKRRPGRAWNEMQCEWMVPWQPGSLTAVGYKNGRKVLEKRVRSAGAPAKIALSVDGEPLAAEGKDIVQVRVATQDASGEFYPYGENRTHFHVSGPGRVRALDNGSPIDVENHFEAKDRIAFYGLTRAYVEATGEAGGISLMASCILGEKKQVSSNMVSIDVQRMALRGDLPDAEVAVFYSLDGSKPTTESARYEQAFEVALGTTVKALVTLDGKPVQWLEERFAEDVGFVWDSGESAGNPAASQAEGAKLNEATVNATVSGFHGKGYVQLSNKAWAHVEWYQENDGDAGQTDLTIRYSGHRKNNQSFTVAVVVNGKRVHEKLELPVTGDRGQKWSTVVTRIPIGRGANTIRIVSKGAGGLRLDEIIVE
ncbi:glycoside hydrolase family 2 TIM barrel-domain containing protein [Haloferula sp.]|uniref:glycoside hydrolase family 2 TIM barrel-domain containing protein n=1 Tax=Haloferula sp. TaxID=2497595 RepID=UPI00329D1A6B